MSRGNQPEQIPATANGAAAQDNISDVGLVPPSDRTLEAGAQAAAAMRQTASSSSAAAAPTRIPTAVPNRPTCYCGHHTPTTTGNGLSWTTIPIPTFHRTTTGTTRR